MIKKTVKLTKEQYEKLMPYEKNLMNAYKHSFVHMLAQDFSKCADIYTEVFGQSLTKSQMGCNTCRLNALRKLGELYSNYTTQDKEKTKRGRPKKLEENGETLNEA